MIKNTWLEKIRRRDFNKNLQISLYTFLQPASLQDRKKFVFPERYPWEEVIIIYVNESKTVYGCHAYLEESIFGDYPFEGTFHLCKDDIFKVRINF